MPRMVPTNWKVQMEVFQRYGCRYKRKKGSHHILTHPNAKRAVVIPEYDEIDIDIIKNNMRTVGMSRDEYFELLKQIQKDQNLNSAIVEDAGRKIP